MIHLNNENFKSEVMKSDTSVIIDFWAEWCGPCRMLGPIFEELSSDYEGTMKFTKLNIEEQPQIAASYRVMSIPTMLIVKDGKEVERIVGAYPKELLKQKIDEALAGF